MLLFLAVASAASGATTRNDDSCDISVAPAATLLLPYFETDFEDRLGETTIFSVTNITNTAKVARVTLWTDFSYPVYSFNLYLTGFDIQALNVYDILRGRIAFRGTGASVSPQGEFSKNPELVDAKCADIPQTIPEPFLSRMQLAFTEGRVFAVPSTNQLACANVGNVHENAVGYITIDVVGNCDSTMPTDPKYFAEDLRWDNALIGDYQQVNSGQNFAQSSPMVHIRAIGEKVDGRIETNLNNTFYSRFQTAARPNADGRQPLPSTFAARWINGGTGSFDTSFKIWREGHTGTASTCTDYVKHGAMVMAETVVFDEDSNGEGVAYSGCGVTTCIGDDRIRLPGTSLNPISDTEVFPQDIVDWQIAGWVYFNLNSNSDWQDPNPEPQQGWVITSMRAEGRYSIDMHAAILGNGCSDAVDVSEFSDTGIPGVLP